MILSLVYQAIIIVIILTFSFGPSFFALINTGIKYGYRTGAFLALGVALSDYVLCVLVCFLVHFGMANFLDSKETQTFFSIIGGIVLIVFGAFFFKKHSVQTDDIISIDNKLPKMSLMVLKGFFLNLFNPTVWLLWLANVTAISKTINYNLFKMLSFFSIVIGAVLLVEVSKVKLAVKIKQYLTDKIMTIINYITGSALIAFGLFLIYSNYFNK